MPDVEHLIREIAVRHGVAVSRNDPVMILVTIFEHLAKDAANAQGMALEKTLSMIEDAVNRTFEATKNTTEEASNAMLMEGHKAAALQIQTAVQKASKLLENATRETTENLESAIEKATTQIAQSAENTKRFTIFNLTAASIILVAALLIFFS
jgi:hypothetical protein